MPLDALVYRENVPGVFIVENAETAAFRPVTLGERSGDSVIVTDGLSGGEELVVVGQTGLRPGSKVTWPQGKPTRLSPPRGDAAAEPEDQPSGEAGVEP